MMPMHVAVNKAVYIDYRLSISDHVFVICWFHDCQMLSSVNQTSEELEYVTWCACVNVVVVTFQSGCKFFTGGIYTIYTYTATVFRVLNFYKHGLQDEETLCF